MECLGTAGTAAQALAMGQELRPGIVIIDIAVPSEDGFSATRRTFGLQALTTADPRVGRGRELGRPS
jgi:DNA-binding NarL/FixJ family response regulator